MLSGPAREGALLEALTALFYARTDDLARFSPQTVDQLPEVYRSLLAHEHHMTVAVEAHHGQRVDVAVARTHVTPEHYAREIVLVGRDDRRVVQYGIMRIAFRSLAPEVRARIEAADTPLGRILIEHDVLRRIHLLSLWRVEPGPALSRLLDLDAPRTTWGRTALILLDEQPAVELLEIVTPEP